jgi:hypothetical protein
MSKFLYLSMLFLPLWGSAQNVKHSFNPDLIYQLESQLDWESNTHTSIKPFLKSTINSSSLLGSEKQRFFKRIIEKKIASFSVYPILNASGFVSNDSIKTYPSYFYGLGLNASIAQRLAGGFNLAQGNQANVPWIDSLIKKQQVVPGIAEARPTSLGYAYTYLDFYINYKASDYFLFELGKGKHFIGDGYRSMLLSDNTAPYPYFKILTSAWKFNYLNLWGVLNNYDFLSNKKNYKLMALHYLSFKPTKRWTLAFFENIIYANRDTSGRSIRADVNYFNPVVFFRPVEYSLGSADNAFIGFNFKFKPAQNHELYGQIMIDEFFLTFIRKRNGWWANKQAFQGGYKWFNVFKLKGLGLQAEANYIRPYTYSHALVTQNYAHLNQSLAHPLGANCIEAIGIIRYQYQQWMLEGKANLIQYGEDMDGKNYGGNIFNSYTLRPSDFGNFTTQGLLSNRTHVMLRASYYIWPKANISFNAGVIYRIKTSVNERYSFQGVFVGIQSRLFNSYTDF